MTRCRHDRIRRKTPYDGVSGAGARTRGFSLFELVVTLSVAAILATIAVPSYRSLVQSNGLTTQTNELVGALNYARATAVTRGTTVTLCSSADRVTCRNDTDWSTGWLVYTGNPNATPGNGADVLRAHRALAGGVTLTASTEQPIDFNSSGFAMSGHSIEARAEDASATQTVCIAATGRVATVNAAGC